MIFIRRGRAMMLVSASGVYQRSDCYSRTPERIDRAQQLISVIGRCGVPVGIRDASHCARIVIISSRRGLRPGSVLRVDDYPIRQCVGGVIIEKLSYFPPYIGFSGCPTEFAFEFPGAALERWGWGIPEASAGLQSARVPLEAGERALVPGEREKLLLGVFAVRHHVTWLLISSTRRLLVQGALQTAPQSCC